MSESKKKIVIDRKKWLRGEGPIESYLLRATDGKMCCLGQFLSQLGLPNGELRNMLSPSGLSGCISDKSLAKLIPGFLLANTGANSQVGHTMMNINDSSGISDSDREADLKALFEREGYELEFVGSDNDEKEATP